MPALRFLEINIITFECNFISRHLLGGFFPTPSKVFALMSLISETFLSYFTPITTLLTTGLPAAPQTPALRVQYSQNECSGTAPLF